MSEVASRLQNRSKRCDTRKVLDRLSDAFIGVDACWCVTFVNSAAERFLGRCAPELLGHVLWTEKPELVGGRFENECRQAIREQLPREFEEYDTVTDTWREYCLTPSADGLTIHVRDISLRKRVEMAQEDKERWYATLVNSVNGIVWVADANTLQFSFVSRQAERVLGYPVERWLKEPDFWRNHVHPEDVGWCLQFCAEASAQGRDHEFDYRMIAADGRTVWLRDIVNVKIEDGVMRLRGIMLDITEQKRVQEQLQRKEEYFRRLVENAWDIISVVAQDGTLLFISPAVEKSSSYKPEDMVGKRGFEWIHPDDVERSKEFLREVFLQEHKAVSIEYRVRHKDGSWRTVESTGKRFVDDHGRTVAVLNSRDITDRSRIEKRLRESEARFRLLFEKNAAGMAISDGDYRFLQVNRAFCEMLGYSEHEFLQMTVPEITLPEDFPETERRFKEVKAGRGQVMDFEKRYVRKDGGIVWGHLTAIYVFSEGKPIYCIATIQDITARKLADEALRVSEERYRSLVLASAQIVWVTNAVGEATPGQPSWIALTGQSDEEVRGWGWLDAVHPDDRRHAKREWVHAVRHKLHYQSEFRIRTARGEYRDFAVRGVPVLTPDGNIREWVGTCTDITEQKRAAADIFKWKTRYEAAIAASGQLLYDVDLSTKEVTYGGNLHGLLGYSLAEMEGGQARWIELIHPDDRDAFMRLAERCRQTHEPFHQEYRVRHKDGSYRVVNDEGRYYCHDQSSNGSMIGFVSDITERRNTLHQLAKAKEEAEAANQAKDDFLAALSHELRTPLNPVLMLTSELEHADNLPSAARQDFAMIRKNVELEARIIDDLLDLTRVTRGKLQLQLAPLEADVLIRQTLDIVRSEVEAKQINLTLDLSASDHCIRGDSVRLQQVFWNILKNAVKFTPSGGTVTVRSRNTKESCLLLEFSDTGIGITAEDKPHIFEAFLQGKGAGSHQFGGLGLGLTISKQIVEQLQGRIWAESAGLGSGSTFYIELPLAAAETVQTPAEPPPVAEPARGATGSRILLVEDHEPTRVTLSRLLTRKGYRVSSADTVAAARNLAAHNKFDLVTSDIGLPDGSGHELMAELRDRYGLTGIALSGYGMEADVQRSLASGFTAHLTKPVDMQSLQHAIADVEKHNHTHAHA